VILGFELRAYTLSHSPALFCEGFFHEIGSRELFAWAGMETMILPISASGVERITGVSHWCPTITPFESKQRKNFKWQLNNGLILLPFHGILQL
jgi:hypothetical protein